MNQKTNHIQCAAAAATTTIPFVTRRGADLCRNGQIMRFAGTNMYWLGLSEDGSVYSPSHSDIDLAMNDAQTMRANVIRTMGAMSVGCALCIEPSLNVFNDGTNGTPNAFDSLDYAIEAAKQRNIRLIMPLVDNYNYFMGGKFTYLAWRGITADSVGSQFFTDSTVRQDYKNHIAEILNHVNPYTGLAYKNDSTIMAWETGNELSVYPNTWTYSDWTGDIASYIKSIDSNHLVADGHYGIYSINSTLDTASLQLPSVDMYSAHAYSNYHTPSEIVYESNTVKSYNKVFFLGEYSCADKDVNGNTLSWTLPQMLSAIEQNNISGDLYWELLPSYVQHNDGYTLHWPGDTTDMQTRARELQTHAFVMRSSTGLSRDYGISPASSTITTIDDSIPGTEQNQWIYTGVGWNHCINCNETTPTVTYYNASQSWDSTTNDTASITFTGTQIAFYGATATWHGIGGISIDGGPETNVDFYSINKTGNALVYTSPVLSNGTHTCKIRVTGTHNTKSTGTTIVVDRVDITSRLIATASNPNIP